MDGSDADDGGHGGGATDTGADGDLGPGETKTRDPITGGPSAGEPIVESAVEDAVASTPTAIHARLKAADRATRPDRVSSILVALGPGPHSGATVDVARAIADATDAWLELFHVVPSESALADGSPISDTNGGDGPAYENTDEYALTGERLISAARDRLGDFDRADSWLVEDRSAAGAIVEQSEYYDLVVIGAPTTGTVGRFVFGSTTDTVIDDAAVPVVVVEAAEATPLRGD